MSGYSSYRLVRPGAWLLASERLQKPECANSVLGLIEDSTITASVTNRRPTFGNPMEHYERCDANASIAPMIASACKRSR